MIKTFSFLLLFVPILLFGQYKSGLNIDVDSYMEHTERLYPSGKKTFEKESDDEKIVEIILTVKNNSDEKINFRSDEILIEGSGYTSQAWLIDGFTLDKNIKISPHKTKSVSLVYTFPIVINPRLVSINSRGSFPITDTDDQVYFDTFDKITKHKSESFYYRRFDKQEEGTWIMRDFYSSDDQLKQEVPVSWISPLRRNGLFTSYHPNGEIDNQGSYSGDKRSGLFESFYATGEKKSLIEYFPEDSVFYHQFWNPSGDSLLVFGKGVVPEDPNRHGHLQFRTFKNHAVDSWYSVRTDKKDTIYTICEKPAEYRGGMRGFYTIVGKNMMYPASARRYGIQGRVYVQFLVNEQGKLEEVETVKGIGSECDAESERVIKLCQNWIPASHNGRAVKQRMVLPIIFRLSI